MDTLTELYGHPQQIQPSHIVITSPYFDTRESNFASIARFKYPSRVESRQKFDKIVEMRKNGVLWKDIAEALGSKSTTLRTFYVRYLERLGT